MCFLTYCIIMLLIVSASVMCLRRCHIERYEYVDMANAYFPENN